jgi:hypothetical protein
MVYFPQEVFTNITSYLKPLYPTRPHPVARMLESELGVWMLSLRLNNAYDGDIWPRDVRKKIFGGFFRPCYPESAFNIEDFWNMDIYKQRFAGAKIDHYKWRPTILNEYDADNRGIFQFYLKWRPVAGHLAEPDKKLIRGARLNNEVLFGKLKFTNKDIKKYLKANRIQGYSKKKRIELINMCMSF